MGNSYLNEELTKMLFSIYESITDAKNMYENLPSVIKQNANSTSQYNNTLSTLLFNAEKCAKELISSYGIY